MLLGKIIIKKYQKSGHAIGGARIFRYKFKRIIMYHAIS